MPPLGSSTKKRKRDSSKDDANINTTIKPKNTLHSFFSKQRKKQEQEEEAIKHNGTTRAVTREQRSDAAARSSDGSKRPKKRLKIMNRNAKVEMTAALGDGDVMSDQDDTIIPFDGVRVKSSTTSSSFKSDASFLKNNASNSHFKGTQFFSSLHTESKIKHDASLAKYDLWAEKYRPKALPDLIGNQLKVDKLSDWLRNWHRKWVVQLARKKSAIASEQAKKKSQKKKVQPKMKASDFQDKSVLIYGKPGIGKTTAARLVAESLGFEVLEMNASDTRSKNSLKEQVAQLVDNQSMFRYCTNLSSNASSAANTKKRQCLIMDEVDGMSTGDRGGIAELLKIIRTSRMPIICIANDGRDQKLKSLRAYSMDMQFDAPPEQVIFVKMRNLCQKENLKITDQALRNIINSLDGDIRAIVTNLQFMAKRQTKEKSQQIMQGAQDVQKDSQIPNIFSLADSILRYHQNFPPRWNQMTVASKSEYLKGAPRPLKQFIDYYFYDTMFIPLLIEQNYINMHPYILKDVQEPHLSDQRFKRINSAAESISFSDLVDVRIRRDQAWEVAPLHAVTSTIVPSLFVRGNYHRVMPYDSHSIKFPSILGKSSAARKNQVELGDLSASISTTGNASGVDLILDGYAEMLDRKFGTILKTDDGIDEAIKLMQEYNLSRSDLDLLAKHAQCIMPTGALSFSGVSANTKRALTKAYKEQIGGESVGRVAKAKRGKSLDEASESDEDETDDEPEFKPVVTKKKTASFASKKRKSKKK